MPKTPVEKKTKGKEDTDFISKSIEDIVRQIQLYDWEDDREHFSSRMYYILAMIQICLSFHGIFGCPLLTITNGGVAFFVPYTLFTIILGYPIHFMETSLGQYSQSGPIKVWNCVPLARGIGLACLLLCIFISFSNNLFAVYAMMYLARSFDRFLPWLDCDSPSFRNRTCVSQIIGYKGDHYTPTQHYFYDHVLQLQEKHPYLIWQQALTFVYTWCLVYFSVFQNIKSLERFLLVFITVPVFCLIALFSLSLQVHGSFSSLKIFFDPSNFHSLSRLSTWCKAAELVLMQLGLSQGTLITYGSYAHHRNKIHKDTYRVLVANFFISVTSTIIIWLFIGHRFRQEKNLSASSFNLKDFSYVFILFTETLGNLPGGRLWHCFLFVLIFMSCLNCQMSIIQTISCVLHDHFPKLSKIWMVITFILCTFLAGCGVILLCSTNGWIILDNFNRISNTLSRIPIASLTLAAILLVYGVDKYCEDINFLIGFYPNFFLKILLYSAPLLMLVLYTSNWYVFVSQDFQAFKIVLSLILIPIPLGLLYWTIICGVRGRFHHCWRSLETWGPKNEEARIARVYFSAESKVTLSKPWNIKFSTK